MICCQPQIFNKMNNFYNQLMIYKCVHMVFLDKKIVVAVDYCFYAKLKLENQSPCPLSLLI